MRKFSLRAGALAATALTLVAVSAAPALADVADRTLPNADDRLFVLQCEGSNVPHHLLQVDVATGVLTGVGAETEPGTESCWAQGFYNPADGLIYSVDWNVGQNNLSTIDPDTGVVASGVSLTVAGSGDTLDTYAVALSPEGTVYAVDSDSLYTVDPETGISTMVGDILLDSVRKGSFYSLAFNPVDGLLYGVDWSTGQNWYTIDTTDGSLTVVNDTWSTTTGYDSAGLTFDSNGVAWYQVDDYFFASAVLPNLEGTTANVYEIQFGDAAIYVESLIYVPAAVVEPTPTPEPSAEAEAEAAAPALAATGVDAGALTAGAGATALLMLAGAALLVARRRQNA